MSLPADAIRKLLVAFARDLPDEWTPATRAKWERAIMSALMLIPEIEPTPPSTETFVYSNPLKEKK